MNKCPLPWMSIETTPTGGARPCCLFEADIPDIDLRKNTLSEAFNSEYMQSLRNQFRAGEKPTGCKKCWTEEAAGKTSKRQFMLMKYANVDYNQEGSLSFLDLKLGNVCNLKCRICGSWSSSKWTKEEIAHGNLEARNWLQQGNWPRENTQFWEDLYQILPGVKSFDFTGGEPFLIQEHFDLLKKAQDMNVASNISIHYNTNGTTFPSNHTVWKDYRHVEIAFSIDNVRERFEYERYPARWDKVQENLRKFRALPYNIELQLCITWNVQNIYYAEEILEWADSMGFDSIHFNMMYDPWFYSLTHLPVQARPGVLEKLDACTRHLERVQQLKTIIEQAESDNKGEMLRRIIEQSDRYRKQDFKTTHSEIARLIEYG